MNDPNQTLSSITGDSTIYGIGGYNTISNLDLMFAFDYSSVGKVDHIVVYRPGSGICWILENQNQEPATQTAVYEPVYNTGDPANGVNGKGIGGYDLADTADRMFAFDLEGSGKLDDLVLYRPRPGPWEGICWILQNDAEKPGILQWRINQARRARALVVTTLPRLRTACSHLIWRGQACWTISFVIVPA